MLMFSNIYTTQAKKVFDPGLRKYFLSIYNYIALALVITGISAFGALNFEPVTRMLYNVGPGGMIHGVTPFGWIMNFMPLVISIYMSSNYHVINAQRSQTLFWIYSASIGIAISWVGLVYTGASLVKTFFICAAAFGAISIYGYTTERDLTSVGAFFSMGLLAIFVVSLINMIIGSAQIYFVTSFLGIFIFLGLIAWDTQRLKAIYYASGGGEVGQKQAVFAALFLYTNIINLFLSLLSFFGERRR